MQYKDKLKDPRWKTFAKQVYARDNYRCMLHHEDFNRKIVAHHRLYYVSKGRITKDNPSGFVEPWEYALGDMITLCETCHYIYHNSPFKGADKVQVPIIDIDTGRIINEDEATRRTRIEVENQLLKDRKLRKKEK